jgi:hypothetical protein
VRRKKEAEVFLCYGPYGYYLKHDGRNYSIPEWSKQNNSNEMFDLYRATKRFIPCNKNYRWEDRK